MLTAPPATAINTATGVLPTIGVAGSSTVALEPVVHLDELARYLQHLDELRRINEGDDTSRSPGYSLNLVRIPVSILPGKLTRTGFGAEITVTATPVITDDLMPTTFHNLAVNDVVDVLGLPLVRATEAKENNNFKYTEALLVFKKQIPIIEKGINENPGNEKQIGAITPAIEEMHNNDTLVDVVTQAIKGLIVGDCPKKDQGGPKPSGMQAARQSDPRISRIISSWHPETITKYRTGIFDGIKNRDIALQGKDLSTAEIAKITNDHLCDLLNAIEKLPLAKLVKRLSRSVEPV